MKFCSNIVYKMFVLRHILTVNQHNSIHSYSTFNVPVATLQAYIRWYTGPELSHHCAGRCPVLKHIMEQGHQQPQLWHESVGALMISNTFSLTRKHNPKWLIGSPEISREFAWRSTRFDMTTCQDKFNSPLASVSIYWGAFDLATEVTFCRLEHLSWTLIKRLLNDDAKNCQKNAIKIQVVFSKHL